MARSPLPAAAAEVASPARRLWPENRRGFVAEFLGGPFHRDGHSFVRESLDERLSVAVHHPPGRGEPLLERRHRAGGRIGAPGDPDFSALALLVSLAAADVDDQSLARWLEIPAIGREWFLHNPTRPERILSGFCPECFHEEVTAHQILHLKAEWAAALVSRCFRHQLPLYR